MDDIKRTEQRSDPPLPIIVAIGASAGGIKALQTFFRAVPPQTGAAYVVVVHLDPRHQSELPKILAAHTKMAVVQVQATEKLRANHVYVIPPDRRLQVVDHKISAIRFDEPPGQRSAIDLFFRSVAERLGDGLAVWGGYSAPPGKLGLGSTLIEGANPNAIVERKFLEDGLICTIIVRLSPASRKEIDTTQ